MAINVEMPLHKARELMAPYRNAMPINMPIPEVDSTPREAPNVLVDAFSTGGPSGKAKPLVRHVLVKDLSKIGTRMKLELPKTGIFDNKAPVGLYALFDGQSCAGDPGPMSAEFCARNFHTKLLARLSGGLPPEPSKASVEAALKATFEDLDQELLTNQPDIKDGCGAAVALLVGTFLFTAVLGRCSAFLGEMEDGAGPIAMPLSGRPPEIPSALVAAGANAAPGVQQIRHPSGRSLGDRAWKGQPAQPRLVTCLPEVRGVLLRGSAEHPFLLLTASSVAARLSGQQLMDIAAEYQVQPRAACGEIATRALEAHAGAAAAAAQCTAVEVCFLPDRPGKRLDSAPEPPAKKLKAASRPGGNTLSVRLRHILILYQDGSAVAKEAEEKKRMVRSREEAESLLRIAIKELRKEVKAIKKKAPNKDAMEVVNQTTKKFSDLCREHSQCETARKGGVMCGDLGWLSPEDLQGLGGSLKEVVDVLSPGQLSDIAVSERGLHLLQRVA